MTTYSFNISQFPNSIVNLDNLDNEIRRSAITVALDFILNENQIVLINFKADLPSNELTLLNSIIASHDNVAKNRSVMDVNIIPETKDFVEQGNTTNGKYKTESWVFDIPADASVVINQYVKNYNICLLGADLTVTSDMVGDHISAIVAPNTLIGAVTADSSGNEVYVNSTVPQNVIPGMFVSFDGSILHELVNVDADKITLDQSVDVITGMSVLLNISIIPYIYFYTTRNIYIGEGINTGQRIPKNTPIQISYYNNSKTSKKICFYVEYLY